MTHKALADAKHCTLGEVASARCRDIVAGEHGLALCTGDVDREFANLVVLLVASLEFGVILEGERTIQVDATEEPLRAAIRGGIELKVATFTAKHVEALARVTLGADAEAAVGLLRETQLCTISREGGCCFLGITCKGECQRGASSVAIHLERLGRTH